MSDIFNPIQYLTLPEFSSTEILVRLERTSLPPDARDFESLPEDFLALLERPFTLDPTLQLPQLVGLQSIAPLFLDAIRLLPPAPPPSPTLPSARPALALIRAGALEYLPAGQLFRWEGGGLVLSSRGFSATQDVNLLTNFRLQFDSAESATSALALLRQLPSIAVAEYSPTRFITVIEPRGRRRLVESEALGHTPTEDAILAQVMSLRQQIAQLMLKVEESKCCKADKVPDATFQKWAFTALHSKFDNERGRCADGSLIRIAMFDLGVDLTHPDLQSSNAVPSSRVRPGLSILGPDDLQGKSTQNIESDLQRGVGLNPLFYRGHHGTAVAGVMIGKKTGFLPCGEVISYQVSAGKLFEYNTDDGKVVKYFPVDPVLYASALYSLGASVTDVNAVNISLGGSAPLCEFEKIGFSQLAAANIMPIAASGNHFRSGDDPRTLYPARQPGVLSVGAVGIEGGTQYYRRAPFSNFDPDQFLVNVMAPGVGIYSTMPTSYGYVDNCGWFNGTSLAAPWISAMYSYAVKEKIPFELDDVTQKLFYQRADARFDEENGYGLVKLDRLLRVKEKASKECCCEDKKDPAAYRANG
jgi:hypothetical protein